MTKKEIISEILVKYVYDVNTVLHPLKEDGVVNEKIKQTVLKAFTSNAVDEIVSAFKGELKNEKDFN